jgi:hypothetical protein
VEVSAESDLEAFITTEGYRCDTGEDAPVVIEAGRIVDEGVKQTRAAALALCESDGRWRGAIVRRMKAARPDDFVPSLKDIEAPAAVGAATTSMRVAWQIAKDAAFISSEEYNSLSAAQLALIDRELAAGRCADETRETLIEMRAEYSRESSFSLRSLTHNST